VISSADLFIPASFLRRMAAMIYDSFVVFSFILLITTLAFILNRGQSFLPIKELFMTYLALSTGFFLAWFWQKSGQTLGMLAWKIKLVDMYHNNLTWKTALLRYFLALFSLSLGGLGFLWCLVDKDNQALHDRLAGTRVVRLLPQKAKNDPSS
jgi:uncharacterized RDD family membrane protein YckC